MSHQQSQSAPLLSRDPVTAMQEMMSTIDSIRDVYTRETDALTSSNTKAFLEIQDEKLQAARRYQKSIEEMLTRTDEMKAMNPLTKKRLFEMQREFSDLTKKNLEALDRMQRTVASLGETISQVARDSAKKHRTFSYGQTGKVQEGTKRTVSMGVSETA